MLVIAELRPWLARLFSPPPERLDVFSLIPDTPFKDKPFEALLLGIRLKEIGANPEDIKGILKEPQLAAVFSLQSAATQTASATPPAKPAAIDPSNPYFEFLKPSSGAQRGPMPGGIFASEFFPFRTFAAEPFSKLGNFDNMESIKQTEKKM